MPADRDGYGMHTVLKKNNPSRNRACQAQIWNNSSIIILGMPLNWETCRKGGIQKFSDVMNANTVVTLNELNRNHNLKDTGL